MSGSYRVKFRTGRDPNDSEAQTSAGSSQHHEDASGYHRPHGWSVDSLHRTMRFLMHGLEISDNNLEIHDLVADADQVLDVVLSYYKNTEIIHEDTDRLRAVLKKRRSRLLRGSTSETRHRLRRLSDHLQGMAAKPARTCPAQATQHDSPARPMSSTQGASAKPRTPTFGR